MIQRMLIALAVLTAIHIETTHAEIIACWPEDFHSTTDTNSDGTNGWWYRQAQNGAYEVDSPTNTLLGSGAGFGSPDGVSIWEGGGVPGGSAWWANIRWGSSVKGRVTIEGYFNKTQSDGGDGITVSLQVNGVEQWSKAIDAANTKEVPFKVTTTLNVGDRVDFLVSPNGMDCNWDNFNFNAIISTDQNASGAGADGLLKRSRYAAGEPRVRMINPAYRNTLFSTMPDKKVVVALDAKTKTRKTVKVNLKKAGEAAVLATATLKMPGDTSAFDAAALKPGSYEVVCSASDIAGATTSLPLIVLPPNKPGNEVWFDADGICHVNGKPFYPIGLYHLEDHIDPVNEERVAAGKKAITYDGMYQRAKAKGFNTVINFVINETDPDPFMKLCERHDMMQIRYVWEGKGKLLVDRVSPYRQHPNMLAWATMDEPKESYLFEIGARQYEEIRIDLDPYHPIQIAQCYSDYFAATKDICDLPSPDIYPFQTGAPWWEKMPTWQQEWKSTARLVTTFLEQMRTTLGPNRPLWHIVQGSGGERPVRLPSRLEYRNMVYQGICAGARASLVYAYTCPDTNLNGKQYWVEDAPELWQAMGDMNKELHELMPFLLAPGGVSRQSPQAPDLRALLRTVGNMKCLMVVNIGDNPQTLEVDLGKNWKQAKVLWENRAVTSREGHLQEQIEPLAVKVYQWESVARKGDPN